MRIQIHVKEIILRQVLKLISLFLLFSLYLNYGVLNLLFQKLVEPVTPGLSADRPRYFLHLKASSWILLLAPKTGALSGQENTLCLIQENLGVCVQQWREDEMQVRQFQLKA